MTRSSPEVVEFTEVATSAVVARMDAVAARQRGWINFEPLLDDQAVAAAGGVADVGLFRVFSGRGPAIPVCTWLPGERTRSGIEYVSVGIQHASGPKAVRRLEAAGVAVPETWHTQQDHPKRGLVVAVPPKEPNDGVLAWLLRAARALTAFDLPAEWRALVYPG